MRNSNSRKRIQLTQATPLNAPRQPTINLEASGIDSTINHNPNNNPSRDVIPQTASLENVLFQLRKTETQLAKVDHHIQFLDTALKEKLTPTGLTWNVNVNVMFNDQSFESIITEDILESESTLVNIIMQKNKKL